MNVYKPQSLNGALKIMDRERCIVFAGGTDLMVKNKNWSGLEAGFQSPVMFLNGLNEISGIRKDGSTLYIGALCTLASIIYSSLVPRYMKSVLLQMASPAIRNVATIGGNICNASPAGDSLPLLYALDAMLVIDSMHHRRKVPIRDFILGPGRTTLARDEILVEIVIPLDDFDVIEYRKVGTRKSTALSKLSFSGFAKSHEGIISDIRLAFGAVGPTVVRDIKSEREIVNMSRYGVLDMPSIRNMYGSIIKPIDDQRSAAYYRKAVALRLLDDFIINRVLKR